MQSKRISRKVSRIESDHIVLTSSQFEDFLWEDLIHHSGLGQDYNPRFVEKKITYDEATNVDTYELLWYEAEGLNESKDIPEVYSDEYIQNNYHCVGPHNPVQHRDGKLPWCEICGLTINYKQPEKKHQ